MKMGANTKHNVLKSKKIGITEVAVKTTKINFVNITKEEVESKILKAYKYAI